MTHTKEPWLLDGTLVYALTHSGWVNGQEQFKNIFSARVTADNGADESIAIENARLIAAAPDLLEALEGVGAMFQRYSDRVGAADDWAKTTIKQVHAAIAKAKGETET